MYTNHNYDIVLCDSVLCVLLSDCGLPCVLGVGFPGNPQSFTSPPTASLPKSKCVCVCTSICSVMVNFDS